MRTRVFPRQIARFLPARVLLLAVALVASWSVGNLAVACKFHGPEIATFAQEIEITEIVVMAKLTRLPVPASKKLQAEDGPKATFEIYHVVKGGKKIGQEIEARYLGDAKIGEKFLVYGETSPTAEWLAAQLSDNTENYIRELVKLPEELGERMVKLQKYLADTDRIVRFDAASEFTAVEVRDLLKIKHKLDVDQIRKALADPKIDPPLMALHYQLLGFCGNQSDVPFFENLLNKKADDPEIKRLDSIIGAYLMLTKEAGLGLVEKKILLPAIEKDEFARFNFALMALRFHGDEGLFIKKEKIAPILAKFLDYPDRADLVIMDLSRWQHWESVERIMKLYRETSSDENAFLREPAIHYMNAYLKTDPKSEKIKGYLAEMERIDPDAFRRAKLFAGMLSKNAKSKSENPDHEKKHDHDEKPAVEEPMQSTSKK